GAGGREGSGGVGRDGGKRGPGVEREVLREGGQRGRVRVCDERVADGDGEPGVGEGGSERVQRGRGSGEAHHGVRAGRERQPIDGDGIVDERGEFGRERKRREPEPGGGDAEHGSDV